MSAALTTVYLACRYGRRQRARDMADEITAAGIAVTSRWLGPEGDPPPDEYSPFLVDRYRARQAEIDLEDVSNADCLLLVSERFCISSPIGAADDAGRHFAAGGAAALCKPIVLLGEPESIFHLLPGVIHAATMDAAIGALLAISAMLRMAQREPPF